MKPNDNDVMILMHSLLYMAFVLNLVTELV